MSKVTNSVGWTLNWLCSVSPTMVTGAPPAAVVTVSPMANPLLVSSELATPSPGASARRPSISLVGAPGWPGSVPITATSTWSPLARKVSVASPNGPAWPTPSTLPTSATTSGRSTLASRLLRASEL